MRIAAFISHPIQYFTPLWQEISRRPGVDLTVYYFSRHGLEVSRDPGFGVSFAWDIDLLAGHKHEFLPRQWPTTDPLDHLPRALNRGISETLSQGWDVVFVCGYAQRNNWYIVARCHQLGIPVLCVGDTTRSAEGARSPSKRALKRMVLSWFFRRVTAFLAAGGQTRAYFQHYGAKRESIFICPYAVDIARFRGSVAQAGIAGQHALRERFGVPEQRRIVMFCGKLASWKRPQDVSAAMRILDRPDIVTVFVGEGELHERLISEGEGRTRVTGFVNQSDIPLALSLAHVLVLPSEHEPYGMVVAEAQCLGVPAIVSDACGCHGEGSVLVDGQSGFVFPTANVPALAAKLSLLLDDERLHQRMSEAARLRGDTQSETVAADGFMAAAEYAVDRSRRRLVVGRASARRSN